MTSVMPVKSFEYGGKMLCLASRMLGMQAAARRFGQFE